MKTEKELFEMANDFDFYVAIDEACKKTKNPTDLGKTNPFHTVGHRITLIKELEAMGFVLTKSTLP